MIQYRYKMAITRTRRRSKTNGRTKTTTTTSKKGISRSYSKKLQSGTRVTNKNGKQTMTWKDAAGYRVTSSTKKIRKNAAPKTKRFGSSRRSGSSGSYDETSEGDHDDLRNSLWHTHGKFYTIVGGIILLLWILSHFW